MRSRSVFYSAGCALALVSCSDGYSPDLSPSNGACGWFSSQLRIEDKFSQRSTTFISGEPITFNMRITNNRDAPVTLVNPDLCPTIRFVVLDSGNGNVFDSAGQIYCAQVTMPVNHAPGETKEFEIEWKQTRSDDGSQVPAGEYTIDARYRPCAGDLDRTGTFAIQ
jgi:hypothetical protein